MTRLVEANWKVMAAVKLPPLRKIERPMATAAYEQEEDAAPSIVARRIERGRSSGRRRAISLWLTTAWMMPEIRKPKIRAQRICQAMMPAISRA